MDELKPCPFCGMKPVIEYRDLRMDGKDEFIYCNWVVLCLQCGTKKSELAKYRLTKAGSFEVFNDNYDGRARVIEKWNRRVSQ